MRNKIPTVRAIEQKLHIPTKDWNGRCHQMSFLVRTAFDIDCRACYGHWYGPVHEDSYFSERVNLPFQRHGWLEMPDTTILDVTRWVFEAADPYVYHGPNDYYDEGGNMAREAFEDLEPVPGPKAHSMKVALHFTREQTKTRAFVQHIFKQPPEDLNIAQVGYLASLSLKRLAEHARPIFEAIIAVGQRATIPLDNRLKVLGEDYQPPRHERGLFIDLSDGPYEEKR